MTTTTRPRHMKKRPGTVAKANLALTSRAPVAVGGVVMATATVAGGVAMSAPAMAAPAGGQVVVLNYGSRGSLVTVAQQRLHITADGAFGPQTRSAVLAFQGRHGLARDGVVGPMTWARLGGFPATSGQPRPAAPRPTCAVTTIRYGVSGPLVSALQRRLGVTADGHFGPLTLNAVKSYQTRHRITADGSGVVGRTTWAALGGAPCGVSANPPGATPPSRGGARASTPTSSAANQIIATAKQYLGVPYVWGGTTPRGFDCSGLTSYAYARAGLSLPRVAAAQQSYLKSTQSPQPGDLVFFGSPAHHVGIYLGGNQMIAAPYPGQVVRIQGIYNPTNYGTLR